MKKIVTIIAITIITVSSVYAQNGDRRRIETLKISFITNLLDLQPNEAEKFWPIYNKYTDEIIDLKRTLDDILLDEVQGVGGLQNISEENASSLLQRTTQLENSIFEKRNELQTALKDVISPKKIMLLKKAEREFNKRMLQEFGKRRRLE